MAPMSGTAQAVHWPCPTSDNCTRSATPISRRASRPVCRATTTFNGEGQEGAGYYQVTADGAAAGAQRGAICDPP